MKRTLLVLFAVVFLTDPANTFIALPEEALLNFPRLVRREGADYTVEEHTARTSDGYVLAVHRLRHTASPQRLVPVLLMHGITLTSEEFVRMGRNRSLAYLLANKGFDVWVGNFRGNEYTSHVALAKSDLAYWNISLDDHGISDLPAILETMRLTTGSDRLHYVGYSMGTTSYHIMCHAHPNLAARVASYTALAPVASISPLLRDSAISFRAGMLRALQKIGLAQLGSTNRGIRGLFSALCAASDREREVCMRSILKVFGEDYDQFDWAKYPTILYKLQAPALHLVDHYMQLAITGRLAKFDYGKTENMERYGQSDPPKYDLTANRAPVAIFFGKNDQLAPPQVALKLAKILKKTNSIVYERPIPYEKFNHADFMWAKDLDRLLTHDVVKMLLKFSKKYDSSEGEQKIHASPVV